MKKQDINIIYMGTPDFAVEPLKELLENQFNVVAVVTSADKPAGRGLKIQESAVKKFALEKGLKILQPEKLKSPEFIQTLKDLNPHLAIVVAFRMLPEEIWSMPKLGTINLHASLLPQYRGAAPINWAIINGENETGVTTFFIEKEIDTGKIIFQEKVELNSDTTAGELHDTLMTTGAKLVVKTASCIINNEIDAIPQSSIKINSEVKAAPKIFKENCLINWTDSTEKTYNLIRGLSPYPTAWTNVKLANNEIASIKIFEARPENNGHNLKPGSIVSDNKSFLKIATSNGFINILSLQISGKKKMAVKEFLNGININEVYII